jgi:hypothetical protein
MKPQRMGSGRTSLPFFPVLIVGMEGRSVRLIIYTRPVRVLRDDSQVDYQLCWNLISETAALATALRGEIAPAEDGMRGSSFPCFFVTKKRMGIRPSLRPFPPACHLSDRLDPFVLFQLTSKGSLTASFSESLASIPSLTLLVPLVRLLPR